MPLYEYICDDCHQRTEILQKMGDAPATVCPNCGGKLRKQISAPAFQFKGSGWYLTDYANRSTGESATARSEEKGKDAGAPGTTGPAADGSTSSESKKSEAPVAAPATAEKKSTPAKSGD